jgi:hypothetical protein
MGENRDEYSGKRTVKGVVRSKPKEGPCPVEAFFSDTGSRDDLKNQELLF